VKDPKNRVNEIFLELKIIQIKRKYQKKKKKKKKLFIDLKPKIRKEKFFPQFKCGNRIIIILLNFFGF